VEAVQRYLDAGFGRVVMQNAGPGSMFIDFYSRELDARLRRLGTPQSSG